MDAISSVSTPTVLTPAVFVSPTSVSGTAPSAEPATATAPAPETPYSQNRDRYKELVDIIVNRSGSFSLDERLKAFSDEWEMVVKGQLYCGGLMGADHESSKLSDEISNSDLYQRMDRLGKDVGKKVISAVARGEDPGFTMLQWFAALSEDDQKVFYTSQNGFDMAGNRQYASFDSYRNHLVEFAQANAAYKGANPALAESLKAIDSSQSGADWGAQILSLFKTIGTKNTLPDHPRTQVVPELKPSVPVSYNPGNLRDRVA